MKSLSGFVLSSLLLGAICVVPNTWMASGADAAHVRTNVVPLVADLQEDVSKIESRAVKEEEHGLPQAAEPVLNKLGRRPITNSMVVSWIVAVGVIVFAQVATRKRQRVPNSAQDFWEWLVENINQTKANQVIRAQKL